MTGEILTLTISGLIVNLAGIAVTAWISHRRLRAHVDRKTSQQTEDIQGITDQQTEVLISHRDGEDGQARA